MKTLHEFHDALTKALDAIEGAQQAEERKANAERGRALALSDAAEIRRASEATKAEADSHVERQGKLLAELCAGHDNELATHKTRMETAAADAKTATDAASETLEGINRQIAEGRAEVQKLNAAKARIRAEIADALKGDGE